MSLRRIRASRQVAEQLLFYDTCWNSVAYLSSDPSCNTVPQQSCQAIWVCDGIENMDRRSCKKITRVIAFHCSMTISTA